MQPLGYSVSFSDSVSSEMFAVETFAGPAVERAVGPAAFAGSRHLTFLPDPTVDLTVVDLIHSIPFVFAVGTLAVVSFALVAE